MTHYDLSVWRRRSYPLPLYRPNDHQKKRPAVVVSSSTYNRERQDLILVAVTSQLKSSGYFGDVIISQWQQAGLIRPSVVKSIFTTVEKGLALKKLGRLGQDDRRALKETLEAVIGE